MSTDAIFFKKFSTNRGLQCMQKPRIVYKEEKNDGERKGEGNLLPLKYMLL